MVAETVTCGLQPAQVPQSLDRVGLFGLRRYTGSVTMDRRVWTGIMILAASAICLGCGGSVGINPRSGAANYWIAPRAVAFGTISPGSNQLVSTGGASAIFSANADNGYSLLECVIDGLAMPRSGSLQDGSAVLISGNTLQIKNIQGTHAVAANFTVAGTTITLIRDLGMDATYYAVDPVYCSSSGTYAVCMAFSDNGFGGF